MVDDAPPYYEFDASTPSPVYTARARSSERLLQFGRPALTGCPACDWIADTKHMKINMGSRVWGLETPSYGSGSTIEGTVQFSGLKERVERVTVTLMGDLAASLTNRGNITGDPAVPIIVNTFEIYSANKSDTFTWDQERPFTIAIPSNVKIHGRSTPTPPSFFALHQNVVCEISYALKFHMTRKGTALNKKHEIKIIPILYLPKSSPPGPPLTTIPRMPRGVEAHASLLTLFERVKTIEISPTYSSSLSYRTKLALENFRRCVNLSLPSPQCFTAGELIPFTLSLVFPKDPMLAALLAPTTQIHLVKRLIVRDRRGQPICRDTCISSAELRTSKEFTEGVRMLRGAIQAGTVGGEVSWQIGKLAEVQYILCASLRPPDALVDHIPSFRHEEVIEIMTDYWGTLGRELSSVGGLPTPALGLVRNLRRE